MSQQFPAKVMKYTLLDVCLHDVFTSATSLWLGEHHMISYLNQPASNPGGGGKKSNQSGAFPKELWDAITKN